MIAAVDLLQVELPLSFFRQGRIAYGERKYIDAIYQFYFMFETMFGNGKIKKTAIKKEFKISTELRAAAEDFLKSGSGPFLSVDLAKQVRAKFEGFDADRLIAYMVDLRGLLHHHTSKRIMWHPSTPAQYSLDAMMFFHVAMKIYLGLLFKYVDDEKVIVEYRQSAAK